VAGRLVCFGSGPCGPCRTLGGPVTAYSGGDWVAGRGLPTPAPGSGRPWSHPRPCSLVYGVCHWGLACPAPLRPGSPLVCACQLAPAGPRARAAPQPALLGAWISIRLPHISSLKPHGGSRSHEAFSSAVARGSAWRATCAPTSSRQCVLRWRSGYVGGKVGAPPRPSRGHRLGRPPPARHRGVALGAGAGLGVLASSCALASCWPRLVRLPACCRAGDWLPRSWAAGVGVRGGIAPGWWLGPALGSALHLHGGYPLGRWTRASLVASLPRCCRARSLPGWAISTAGHGAALGWVRGRVTVRPRLLPRLRARPVAPQWWRTRGLVRRRRLRAPRLAGGAGASLFLRGSLILLRRPTRSRAVLLRSAGGAVLGPGRGRGSPSSRPARRFRSWGVGGEHPGGLAAALLASALRPVAPCSPSAAAPRPPGRALACPPVSSAALPR